jgi:predicted nucleic acid-binding Zn ribbon protein
MSRRAGGDPQRVVVSLPGAARLLGAEGAVELAAVKRGWADAVGPAVAAHCWPLSLDHGVLTVVADHSAWAFELRIQAAALLGRIQSVGSGVRSLTVQVGLPEGRSW